MCNIITTTPIFTAEQIDTSVNKRRRMSTVSLESFDQIEEKRVRFADDVSVSSIPSPLDQLESEITSYSELWYQLSDLALFRDEARLLCREMRRQDEEEPSYNPRLLCLSRHEQTRGLEQRSCLERQRRKYLASRFILKAAQQGKSPPQLAAISQRITAWAAELAVQEAQRDFVRAYAQSQSPSSKRSLIDVVASPERRVRPRLMIVSQEA